MGKYAVDKAEENKLGAEVSLIEQKAQAMQIVTDEDFKAAGEAVKTVKTMKKRVDEYWEPMRKSTYNAYTAVNKHKKEMSEPLKTAEDIIKKKMADYQARQAEIRRAQEAEMRRLAREEMNRKMAEAEEAEKNGDAFGADYAKAEAEALGAMADTVVSAKPVVKADGVVQKKAWEITGIDLSKLPCEFGGVCIRPADESAIMKLIRESKGGVEIPGVTFRETATFAVRV